MKSQEINDLEKHFTGNKAVTVLGECNKLSLYVYSVCIKAIKTQAKCGYLLSALTSIMNNMFLSV